MPSKNGHRPVKHALPDVTPRSFPLMVNGRERRVIFDFNALARFEEETGLNALDDDLTRKMTATQTRAFLWAGLLCHEPELTIQEAGAMFDVVSIFRVGRELRAAIQAATQLEMQEAGIATDPLAPAAQTNLMPGLIPGGDS